MAGPGKKRRKRKLSEKGASMAADKSGASRRRSSEKAERPPLCKAKPLKEGAGKCATGSPAASAGLVVSHTGSETVLDAVEVEQVR